MMKMSMLHSDCSSLAMPVAPEDLRRGDYVAVLSEIIELPSFLWDASLPSGREELVRICRLPTECRAPRRIKAICLPFVLVKLPNEQFHILDVRLDKLARLERNYAKFVWKSLRRKPKPNLAR